MIYTEEEKIGNEEKTEVTDYEVISDLNAILEVENLCIEEEERKKGNNSNIGSQKNLFEEISKIEKR